MSSMRRLTVVALPLAVLIACSSGDDGDPSDLGATSDAAAEGGAGADAKASPDASADANVDAAPAVEFSGEATYYAADGTGACGLPASPNDLNVAAMNGSQYKKSWCGQCVLVTGPKGSVKVRIVDLCPGCAQGDLDLSKQSFTAIATLSAGRVKITWHAVAC